MTYKGLNFLDDCAAECVPLYPQKEECIVKCTLGHSKMYTSGIIANSQTDRTPTEINRNCAVAKVRILVELGIL